MAEQTSVAESIVHEHFAKLEEAKNLPKIPELNEEELARRLASLERVSFGLQTLFANSRVVYDHFGRQKTFKAVPIGQFVVSPYEVDEPKRDVVIRPFAKFYVPDDQLEYVTLEVLAVIGPYVANVAYHQGSNADLIGKRSLLEEDYKYATRHSLERFEGFEPLLDEFLARTEAPTGS